MTKKEEKTNVVTETDFLAYERVREEGLFNMLTPEAREMTGLDYDTYVEIISNYGELAKQYLDKDHADREFGY